jgi:putative transposase
VQRQLKEDGDSVSIKQLSVWFEVPRRTIYYKAVKQTPRVDAALAVRVKAEIEQDPVAGYRTVAWRLGANKNTIQRVFQLKGWQVRKRQKGFRPRVKGSASMTSFPNQRWATDMTRVWSGRDGWCTLALVIDCCTRELLGWRLSKTGESQTAEAALEEALIYRFGRLGYVEQPLLLRSDNGLVFVSKHYTTLVKAYGLKQEFITPYTPEQNGLIERFIRTIKEQCIYQARYESIVHARNDIDRYIRFYNRDRPHQSLQMKTPVETFNQLIA